MRVAPQQVLVSGTIVHIWMLPPWISIVLDDRNVLWMRDGDSWVANG